MALLDDTRRIFLARTLRGLGDGCAAILIPLHLAGMGFATSEIGAISSAMMVGSAAMMLLLGLTGHRISVRSALLLSSALAVLTGFNFAFFTGFAWLLLAALIGTINPTGGDTNIFRPLEQTVLSEAVPEARRTDAFAVHSFLGLFAAALGASASGLPSLFADRFDPDTVASGLLLVYAFLGVVSFVVYRGLRAGRSAPSSGTAVPLRHSRKRVIRMTMLFSLDALGGGFTLTAVLALWLLKRFDMSAGEAGALFFATGICAAISLFGAPPLSRRFGYAKTMMASQCAALGFAALAAFMPTLETAAACLIARSLFQQMDTPARAAFVMAAVPPEERAAATSFTTLPFVLTASIGPFVAGWLLTVTSFGWPLLIGSAIKLAYNIAFLRFSRAMAADHTVHQ
jgi:MFS family permease